ncbi:hypothetical protein [Herpetosiphon gulosus]|uniref:Lantibiotic n=1 Tax=Herpetosiphon gulosus TaxID=1973496 RepID=A0ABP9X5T0_9CHLR
MQTINYELIIGSVELSDEELEVVSAGAAAKSYSCTISRSDKECECTCPPREN